MELVIVLVDVRSAGNVGSIFRTADAVGASKIYLCGLTPSPIDRFGRKRKDISKASLGAEEIIPFESVKSATSLVRKLQAAGFKIIAVEQDRRARDYKKVKINEKMAVVFGGETSGLPKKILALADDVAEIPMRGEKESLNVAVAAGIALYRFARF